ncbi:unnamed protein product [Lathyrus oleraceus]|uniref:Uncharacterized protein n=1 Tax=Pisum sativum TaxID=3888 RepID=A0A9D4XYP5_PEA|nr:hypothetical protein KIW84_034533 [Pisum sativum]
MEGVSVVKKSSKGKKDNLYHVMQKVPFGDSPNVKVKHAQVINVGDKVDSAMKDMTVVMKQLDRTEEAIEVIKYFRGLCSKDSQESIDDVLLELYKVIFKKVHMIDVDANKTLNLTLCLMRQSLYEEAYLVLEQVLQGKLQGSDEIKSQNREYEMLIELKANLSQPKFMDDLDLDDDLVKGVDGLLKVWSLLDQEDFRSLRKYLLLRSIGMLISF